MEGGVFGQKSKNKLRFMAGPHWYKAQNITWELVRDTRAVSDRRHPSPDMAVRRPAPYSGLGGHLGHAQRGPASK